MWCEISRAMARAKDPIFRSMMVRQVAFFGFAVLRTHHTKIPIGFQGIGEWAGYMSGADRMILDSHPYLCFTDQDPSPLSEQVDKPCKAWAKAFNTSLDAYGVTVAGEWSLSFNDCAFCYYSFRRVELALLTNTSRDL